MNLKYRLDQGDVLFAAENLVKASFRLELARKAEKQATDELNRALQETTAAKDALRAGWAHLNHVMGSPFDAASLP